MTISAQLHAAAAAAFEEGWSLNALAHAADVPQASLQAWYTGAQATLSLATADKLAAFFRTELKKPRIPKKPE